MKLGLGTVQFGVDYGISNQAGRTPPEEVLRVLDLASKLNISVLDTAALYGTSEEVLGHCLSPDHQFRIVTKTIKFPLPLLSATDGEQLIAAFQHSLSLLKMESVYALMVHDANDLLKPGGEHLFRAMEQLKKARQVSRIGASIYSGEQIDTLLQRFPLDIVQVPLNILDQRLILDGQLKALKFAGCEVHARSAFLQGALLMDPLSLPTQFESIRSHLLGLRAYLSENGLTPQQGALGFVAGQEDVDAVICGINNSAQLAELGPICGPIPIDLSSFSISDESILNPSLWRN